MCACTAACAPSAARPGAWDMQKFFLDMTARGPHVAASEPSEPRKDGAPHEGEQLPASAGAASAINDFVVKFANVNGSGSASANRLFARSILRMGVPVASRNIFPSNIQGLPTWYEVRVCEARPSRPARRRRPHGRHEPADLGQGRRLDRARRLPVLRFDAADAAVEVPRATSTSSACR